MKIKIIDLLNMISRGEEVPKKIKIKDEIWIYDDEIDYKAEDNRGYLFEVHTRINKEDLNDEVEIIEEDKKIEKSDFQTSQIPPWFRNEELIKVINTNCELQTQAIRLLIDEVNRLKEKE